MSDENFDKGRRELLSRCGKFLLGGMGLWTTYKLGDVAWGEIEPGTKRVIHSAFVDTFGVTERTKEIFSELFLGTQEKVSLIPAQDNPNVAIDERKFRDDPYEIFTRGTLNAAESFANVLKSMDDKIKPIEVILRLKGEGNLIVFGSPTSNLVSRVALRYGQIGDGKAGSEYYPSDALNLKVLFELNGKKILNAKDTPHRICKRFVNGREIEIPNWGIRKPDGTIICPETNNGILTQDYLIISSLPNILNPSSFSSEHRIVNFGGTHVAGTLAVSELMKNEKILEDLYKQIKLLQGNRSKLPYWQARILVDQVEPDLKTSAPVSIGKVLEVEEVEIHEAKLKSLVSKNMKYLQQYAS